MTRRIFIARETDARMIADLSHFRTGSLEQMQNFSKLLGERVLQAPAIYTRGSVDCGHDLSRKVFHNFTFQK